MIFVNSRYKTSYGRLFSRIYFTSRKFEIKTNKKRLSHELKVQAIVGDKGFWSGNATLLLLYVAQ